MRRCRSDTLYRRAACRPCAVGLSESDENGLRAAQTENARVDQGGLGGGGRGQHRQHDLQWPLTQNVCFFSCRGSCAYCAQCARCVPCIVPSPSCIVPSPNMCACVSHGGQVPCIRSGHAGLLLLNPVVSVVSRPTGLQCLAGVTANCALCVELYVVRAWRRWKRHVRSLQRQMQILTCDENSSMRERSTLVVALPLAQSDAVSQCAPGGSE